MNWADSKNSVNSVNPSLKVPEGNTEPRLRNTREGVETKHGESTKVCSCCGAEKPISEYYKKDAKTDRLDSTCKACRVIQSRERSLGVTEAQYKAMYIEQAGRCGICRQRLYSKRYKAFAVDHCHSSGKIRGLLCTRCNTGLGLFKDDPTALQRAIDWIKI